MIYRDGYFKKEMRQAGRGAGFAHRLAIGVFMGLFSFALWFVLQTLADSVIYEKAPQLMQRSYFSTLLIYLYVSFLLISGYLAAHFDTLFFSGIRRNAWYLLIKMGYRPSAMIVSKLAAQSYAAGAMYLAGFAVTAVLTVFIKAPFVYAYLPSLFAAGLADVAVMTVFCMAVSLFVKTRDNARILILLAAAALMLLKGATGVAGLVSDRAAMQSLNSLARGSGYLPACAAFVSAGLVICALRARTLSGYVGAGAQEWRPADGAELGRADETGKIAAVRPFARTARRRVLSAAVTLLLALVIGAALALNVLIILIGTATPGSEVTLRGVIPYVFRSDTMSPSLRVNDLVFFKRIDSAYPLNTGDIVLLRQGGAVYVERVVGKQGTMLTVDIDAYPAGFGPGAMKKTVDRGAVYGICSGRSRWLGALILFANTITGRALFLLAPAVLLFFRKRIFKTARKKE